MVRGWAALSEELVLTWARDPAGVSREELLEAVTAALPMLADLTR